MKKLSALLIVLVLALGAIGFAACGETTYTVKFDVDGTQTEVTVTDGKFEMPADPAKNGYVFDGWYTDKDKWANEFNAYTEVESDMTVYAKFVKIDVTVKGDKSAEENGAALKSAVESAKDGAVIYVEEGTYKTEAITVDGNVSVYGAGADKTVIEESADALVFIEVNKNVDFTLSGVSVKGKAGSSSNNLSGVRFGVDGDDDNDGNLVVKNSKFSGFTKNSVDVNGGNAVVKNNVIECASVEGNTSNGVVIDYSATAAVNGNSITGVKSTAEEWSATGVLVLRNGKITEIKGNTLKNCESGICISTYYDEADDKTALMEGVEAANAFDNCETNVKNEKKENN